MEGIVFCADEFPNMVILDCQKSDDEKKVFVKIKFRKTFHRFTFFHVDGLPYLDIKSRSRKYE